MTKPTDWVKWGSIAGLATVIVTLVAIYVSHSDQRDAVYVTITPLGWKGEWNHTRGFSGAFVYSLIVTGKSPARNVDLRETCLADPDLRSSAPVELYNKVLLGDLPPGTIQRDCLAVKNFVGTQFEGMMYVANVYYQDDRGRHLYSSCFVGGNLPDNNGSEYNAMHACAQLPNIKD